LDSGKPVRLANVTTGETLRVGKGGVVELVVPDSSFAVLEFEIDD
jgi:hypothetical protein